MFWLKVIPVIISLFFTILLFRMKKFQFTMIFKIGSILFLAFSVWIALSGGEANAQIGLLIALAVFYIVMFYLEIILGDHPTGWDYH